MTMQDGQPQNDFQFDPNVDAELAPQPGDLDYEQSQGALAAVADQPPAEGTQQQGDPKIALSPDEYAEFVQMRQERQRQQQAGGPQQRHQALAQMRQTQDEQIDNIVVNKMRGWVDQGLPQAQAAEWGSEHAKVLRDSRDTIFNHMDRHRAIVEAVSKKGLPPEEAMALFDNQQLKSADDIERFAQQFQSQQASTSQAEEIRQLKEQVKTLMETPGPQRFGAPTSPVPGSGQSVRNASEALQVVSADGYTPGTNPEAERLTALAFGDDFKFS